MVMTFGDVPDAHVKYSNVSQVFLAHFIHNKTRAPFCAFTLSNLPHAQCHKSVLQKDKEGLDRNTKRFALVVR